MILRRYLTFFLAVLLSFQNPAQTWQWSKIPGGSVFSALKSDKKGFLYSSGPGYYNSPVNCALAPSFAKHDSLGNILWVQSASINGLIPLDLAIDSSGFIYTCGGMLGTYTVCGGNNTNSVISTPSYPRHCYLSKYTSSGDLVWLIKWNSAGIDGQAQLVRSDSAGNNYVVTHYASSWANYTEMRRYNASGNLLWTLPFTSGYYAPGIIDIDVDISGNCFITGGFQDSMKVGGQTYLANAFNCGLCGTGFVAKISPAGSVLWLKILGGKYNVTSAIDLDNSGNFFIAGNCKAACTQGSLTAYTGGYLSKYDPAGVMTWIVPYPLYARQAATDVSGNVYLSGLYKGTLTFGGVASASVSTWRPDGELCVVKYKSNGAVDWALSAVAGNTLGLNFPMVMTSWKNGVHIGGSFQGITILGSDTLVHFPAVNSNNIFIAKINSDAGNPTGLRNLANNPELSVFPNPVSDLLYIDDENISGQKLVVLYNSNGAELMHMEGKKLAVPMQTYPTGIYCLKIEVDGKTRCYKVIRE